MRPPQLRGVLNTTTTLLGRLPHLPSGGSNGTECNYLLLQKDPHGETRSPKSENQQKFDDRRHSGTSSRPRTRGRGDQETAPDSTNPPVRGTRLLVFCSAPREFRPYPDLVAAVAATASVKHPQSDGRQLDVKQHPPWCLIFDRCQHQIGYWLLLMRVAFRRN